jgi:hypothetical protein
MIFNIILLSVGLGLGEFFSIITFIGIAFYFLPTFLAFNRKKSNKISILLLNLFLGWTFIGWIVALVWAVANDEKQQNIIVNNQMRNESLHYHVKDIDTKNCPFCAESIKKEAKKCKHCGELI